MTIKAYSYVRMSTAEQRKGDSWRRQVARTEEYVAGKKLVLVDTISDLGVSAFRGRNSEVGRLGRFLELVDEGRIASDSFLIVESMDRLSRQSAMQAFALLVQIVNRGITVVTLDDRQEYSKETMLNQQHSLFIALGAMIRSHDESKYKSQRISAVWGEKKRNASQGKILSKQVPGWLRADMNAGAIFAIEDRAQRVREIFELTRDGWGAFSIARELNRRKEPTWSTRSSVWRESYIKKILNGRAVCGEYTPHKRIHEEGRPSQRVPDGEMIADYYPRIIDEALYQDAASAMARRRISGRGRKGKSYSNLLSGLLKCGLCGAGLRYINKGAPPKGGRYLICSVSHAGGVCSGEYYRYSTIESSVLSVIETLDIEAAMGGKGRSRRLSEQKHLLSMRRLEAEMVRAKIAQVMKVIQSDEEVSPQVLKIELRNLEHEALAIAADIATRESELDRLVRLDPAERDLAVRGLLASIRENDGTPRDEQRRRAIAEELRRLLEKIIVKPLVRLAFETIDAEADWQSAYGVKSGEELEHLFRSHPFEFTLIYTSGETSFVDPLGRNVLRLISNKSKLRIWKEISKGP